MHFSTALVPFIAIASSLVEAAPVALTTTRAPRLPFAQRVAYESSFSSVSSASAAAAAASSASKTIWYAAPVTTTTKSQQPHRSSFQERVSASQASVSSSLAAASSASVASAIAAVPSDKLFPTSAPTTSSGGRPLSYAPVQAFYWNGTVQDSSEGARLVEQFPGLSCKVNDQLLAEARARGRTIILPEKYTIKGLVPMPVPAAPCGAQYYLRNPLNPSQGAYFAADSALKARGGVEDNAAIISRQAMAEVFGADFVEGQQLELVETRSLYDLLWDDFVAAASTYEATANPAPTREA
ncbi:hypothetical protein JCM11251_006854 [Rhodosporidiobolus azoricus]